MGLQEGGEPTTPVGRAVGTYLADLIKRQGVCGVAQTEKWGRRRGKPTATPCQPRGVSLEGRPTLEVREV